jgi:hypothetical protein
VNALPDNNVVRATRKYPGDIRKTMVLAAAFAGLRSVVSSLNTSEEFVLGDSGG